VWSVCLFFWFIFQERCLFFCLYQYNNKKSLSYLRWVSSERHGSPNLGPLSTPATVHFKYRAWGLLCMSLRYDDYLRTLTEKGLHFLWDISRCAAVLLSPLEYLAEPPWEGQSYNSVMFTHTLRRRSGLGETSCTRMSFAFTAWKGLIAPRVVGVGECFCEYVPLFTTL